MLAEYQILNVMSIKRNQKNIVYLFLLLMRAIEFTKNYKKQKITIFPLMQTSLFAMADQQTAVPKMMY